MKHKMRSKQEKVIKCNKEKFSYFMLFYVHVQYIVCFFEIILI